MIVDMLNRGTLAAEIERRDRDNAARARREAREAPEREAARQVAAIAEGRGILAEHASTAEQGDASAAPTVSDALRALAAGTAVLGGVTTASTEPTPSDALRVLHNL